MSGAERYRSLFATPDVALTAAAALLARLPLGIIGLALVLFFRDRTGSYAAAGATSAAFAVGNALTAPPAGRLVDRLGPVRVLLAMSAAHAAGILAVVAAGYADLPVLAGALAFLAGAAMPPISSVMRTLWPELLEERGELLGTAFALDAVLVELVFVTGPLIVAVLTALFAPAGALVLSAVVALGGTVAFVTRPPTRARLPAPATPGATAFGALRASGLQTLVLGVLPLGFALGSTEVTLPAFAEAEGNRALAGVLLAVWTVGSATGGVVYGARQPRGALADRHVAFALLLPVLLLPLALAPSFAVMLVLVIPAGAIIAPTLASGNQLVAQVTPPGQATEAYTWPITALVLGVAAGNAAAGAIVQAADWRTAFLVAGVAGLGGGGLLLARRGTLRPLDVPA